MASRAAAAARCRRVPSSRTPRAAFTRHAAYTSAAPEKNACSTVDVKRTKSCLLWVPLEARRLRGRSCGSRLRACLTRFPAVGRTHGAHSHALHAGCVPAGAEHRVLAVRVALSVLVFLVPTLEVTRSPLQARGSGAAEPCRQGFCALCERRELQAYWSDR